MEPDGVASQSPPSNASSAYELFVSYETLLGVYRINRVLHRTLHRPNAQTLCFLGKPSGSLRINSVIYLTLHSYLDTQCMVLWLVAFSLRHDDAQDVAFCHYLHMPVCACLLIFNQTTSKLPATALIVFNWLG